MVMFHHTGAHMQTDDVSEAWSLYPQVRHGAPLNGP
jgi:hypothetical protein